MSFHSTDKGVFENVVVQKDGNLQPVQTNKLIRAPLKYSAQGSQSTLTKFSLDPLSNCHIKRTSRSLDSLIENVPKPKRKYTRRQKLANGNTNDIPKRKYQRKPKHENVNAVPYGNGCFHSRYSVSTPSLEFDLDIEDFQIDDYKLREERFIEELVTEQKKNALYDDIETVVINESSDDDNTLAVPNYTKIPENIFSSPVKMKSEEEWLDYFANCEEFIMETDLVNDAYLPVTLDQNSDESVSSVSALEHNLSFDDLLKDEINLYLIKDFSGFDIDNSELATIFESKAPQKKYLAENNTDCPLSDNILPSRFVNDKIEPTSINYVSEMTPTENISDGGNTKDILNSELSMSVSPNRCKSYEIIKAIDDELKELEKSHRPKMGKDASGEQLKTVTNSNDIEEDAPLLTNKNQLVNDLESSMSLSKLAIDHTYNSQSNQEVHYDHSYFTSSEIKVDPEQLTDDIFENIILNLVKLNFEEIEELQISQHIAADISEKINIITIARNNTSETDNNREAQQIINENNSGTSLESYDVYLNEPFSNTFGKIDEVVISDTEDSNCDDFVIIDDINTAIASSEVQIDNNLSQFNVVENELTLIHENENMRSEKIENSHSHNKHSLLKGKKVSKLPRNTKKYIHNSFERVIQSILHQTKLNKTEEFLREVIKKVVDILIRYCIIHRRQKRSSYKTISKNRLRRHCSPHRKSLNTSFSNLLSYTNRILSRLNRSVKNSFVSKLKESRRENKGIETEQEFDVVGGHEEDLSIPNQNSLLEPTSNIPLLKNPNVATYIDQRIQIQNSLPDLTTDHFENDKCLFEYTNTKVDENFDQKNCLSKAIIHRLENDKCLLNVLTDVEQNINDSLRYDSKNCNSSSSSSITTIDSDHYVNNGICVSEAISHSSDNDIHLLENSDIAIVVGQSVNENCSLDSPRYHMENCNSLSRNSIVTTYIDQCINDETCSPKAINYSSDDDKYKLEKSNIATVVDQCIQDRNENTTDINSNINNENCPPEPIGQNSEKSLRNCLALDEPKHEKKVLRDLQNIEPSKCQMNVESTLKQEDVYMKHDRSNTEDCYGFAIEEIANYMPMTRSHTPKIKIPYSNIVTTRSNSSKITRMTKNSKRIKVPKCTMEVQQGAERKVRILRNRTVITYSNEN